MTHLELVPVPPVAQLAGVSQHYGKTVALNNIKIGRASSRERVFRAV